MRKRIRKKKHVGEYQEFGAEIHILLREGADFLTSLDDFVYNAVEGKHLQFGGGGKDRKISGFLELGRRDCYRDNLARIEAWLSQHVSVESFQLGKIVDAWH